MSQSPEDTEYEKIVDYILSSLSISRDSNAVSLEEPITTDFPVRADIVIRDTKVTYFVEITKRLSLSALSRVTLQQALMEKQSPDNVFIIAANVIPPDFIPLAVKTGIRLFQLPHNLTVYQKKTGSSSKGKLTADKSWRVVTRLLKEKTISIRQISIQEGISYGLSHKVMQELVDSHIATKEGYNIRISDISSLLNIIAWERNMKKLKIDEFWLPHDQGLTAARELSQVCDEQGIDLAGNSFTAAGLYTGYALKHDEIHLYIHKDHITFLKDAYAEQTGSVRAILYQPDRGIMAQSKIIEGVRITSPSQTLLDIAGMGYAGITLAKKMVEIFDRL